MLTFLTYMDSWCYMMIIGAVLAGLSALGFGNGSDKKQRQLAIKFKHTEPLGKVLNGQPLRIRNGRAKPIILAVGLILCMIAYIIMLSSNNLPALALNQPSTGGLFIIPIILLAATILLSLGTFCTQLILYDNAIIIKPPLGRKIYYFDDFEHFEVCVYADRQINYRAFHVRKTKGGLKLWLCKPAHFQLVQQALKDNAQIGEIITERLDTPWYARLKERENT